MVKGACVSVEDLDQGGTDFGGCDGGASGPTFGDQDGKKSGEIVTTRLPNAGTVRVVQAAPFPKGYRKAKPVAVAADPAETGEAEKVTIKPRRR